MKTIVMLILVLLVSGIGAFIFSALSGTDTVPAFVPADDVPATTTASASVPVETTTMMDDWNWITTEAATSGLQFSYPEPLPLMYVTPAYWPPTAERTTGTFRCNTASITVPGTIGTTSALVVVNNHTYCVSSSTEGAAGSIYTTYEYVAVQADDVDRVSFTLRTPQCMNYDEPIATTCRTEQSMFPVDRFADHILRSFTAQ